MGAIRSAVLPALLLLLYPRTAPAEFNFEYLQGTDQRTWILANERLRVKLELTPEGYFLWRSIEDPGQRFTWQPPAGRRTGPIRIRVDDTWLDANRRYAFVAQTARAIARNGRRQTVMLRDRGGLGRVRVQFDMHPDLPVVRWNVRYFNLSGREATVREADMLPLELDDRQVTYRTFKVNQWAGGARTNFEPIQETLTPEKEVFAYTGAAATHCTWLALRDPSNRGLFFGWEYDGRAFAAIEQRKPENALAIRGEVLELNRPVAADGFFDVPPAFLGSFRGTWDDAGWQTQRFVEAAVARPVGDAQFPYVMWDSWGYEQNIDGAVLRRNADIAASIGVEVFIVDLGWSTRIGEWRPDPRKFPTGLRSLSDYVRSLGMKFGLHFALAEAHRDSPVLRANPDWTASFNEGYFGADSLCLAHKPVRDALVEEAVRIIDEYGVDWMLQDGENMVKRCSKTTHTHAPGDSNYANAVDGINAIVGAVQERRPLVLWENCENGGAMMTYAMTRRYVTSIAADNSGALITRQAVYGVTYPFPLRYSDRYMPDEELDAYTTRSFMFGGPWIFMNRLPGMKREHIDFARREIQLYKSLRPRMRNARVFHLTGRPAQGAIDAMQALQESSGSALVFLYRTGSAANTTTVRLRGLNAARAYHVRFQDSGRGLIMQGSQLMTDGLSVQFSAPYSAEIVWIDPVE